MMANLRALVHVYRHKTNLYVVPLVRLANRSWLETEPVQQVARNEPDRLANSLTTAWQETGQVVNQAVNAWDTLYGQNLRQADRMCALKWFDSGTIQITPKQQKTFSSEDDEVGWVDLQDELVERPADTSFTVLAQDVLEYLT